MGATSKGHPQYKVMLTALGQPATDVYASAGSTETGTAADAIVARVAAIRSGLSP